MPSLGSLMDALATQHQESQRLCAQDMRILNWHFANLEYANAVNVAQLSLGGWDQDSGNEFEGRHSQVVGGYTQVIRGLWKYPTPLNVRLGSAVTEISYSKETKDNMSEAPTRVQCADGRSFEADFVVSCLPLGVLHTSDVRFNPPLPKWKQGAMRRLGFGVLNKVPAFLCRSVTRLS